MRMTSDTDDFVSAKSHAREKPLLTGYEGKKLLDFTFAISGIKLILST